jgi:hypothetical protein
VRGGDLSGIARLLMGPLGYLSSPINALVPTESEVYNAPDLPESAKPLVAGGLGLAAMMLPGNKKGMGPPRKQWSAPNARDLSRADLERMDATELDRLAFGRAEGDVLSVRPDELKLKFPDDLVNPQDKFDRGGMEWARSVNFDEPVHVSIGRDGALQLEDGHHRYFAAQKLGVPLRAEIVKSEGKPIDALLGKAPEGITAYHGSPHTFDRFDMSKIGSGEGAQAYGHGLYFAEEPKVAEGYKYVHGGGIPTPDAVTYRGTEVSGLAGITAPDLRPAGTGNPLDVGGLRKSPPSGTSANIQNFGVGATPAKLKHAFPDYSDDEISALQALINSRGDAAKAAALLEGKGKTAAAKIATENASQFKVNQISPNVGSMYQVRLNVKPDELLDWDRPLSEQPRPLQEAVARAKTAGMFPDRPNRYVPRTPQEADALKAAGIKGIRYKDAGSRAPLTQAQADYDKAALRGTEAERVAAWKNLERVKNNSGTYNYVIFDDSLVTILKRYGIPMTAGAGGAVIVSGANMPPDIAAQMGTPG